MIRYISLLLFIGLAFAQDVTIAVLDFDGDGVSQSETRTLTNRLRDEMFKTGAYIVLERGKMDEVLKEQGFQQTGCVTSECAVEVGNMLGVQQMIGGSIGKVGNMYTVSARIIDVETGKVLKSANCDHIGAIERLLIEGMNKVALKLLDIQNDNKSDMKSTETQKYTTPESEYTESTTTQYEARTEKMVESTDKADNIRFAINLASGATPTLSGDLVGWHSTTNFFRASVELPLLMQVLLVGAEVGTFGFENSDMSPATDFYKGVIVMGITGLSIGPLKIKVGAGQVGSSMAFIKEGTLGFRIGGILDIWGGFRSTDVKAAHSTESLELGNLSWEEVCVGITYNWMQ